MSAPLRLAIVGLGGVGGPLATLLVHAGRDVALVAGSEESAEAIRRGGLALGGALGHFDARTGRVTASLEGGPYDAVLLAVRADALEQVARDAAARLSPEGVVVTLQNGIPEPRAQKIVGNARVLGGVVGFGGAMTSPGRYDLVGRGAVTLGEPRGPATERVRRLAAELTTALPFRVTDNLAGARWTKLAQSCGLSAMGALLGMSVGELMALPRVRRAFFVVLSEVVDVARAEGVTLEPIAGMRLERLYVAHGGRPSLAARLLLRALGFRYRRVRSGLLKRLKEGRPTGQIDELSGLVVEVAARHGVRAPMNELVWKTVKAIERGEATLGAHHLAALDAVTR